MIEFTPTELAAFKEELFKGFSDAQFNLAIAEAQRRNLIPGQHIHFQLRSSKEWVPEMNASISVKKLIKVTTIDAFRLISQRTGEYEGQGKARWTYLDDEGQPTITSTIPLPDKTNPALPREPWSCAVPIYRKGFREPVEVEARFEAYAVTRKFNNAVTLTEVWARRGPEMLAKCSEAASRRIAFPEELGSIYLHEEMQREDAEQTPAPAATPALTVDPPKPAHVPEVNHTPAEPTDTPRPNEKPASEQKIEDVVLPKKGGPRKAQVAKALETYMADQGMPIPPHEQPVEPYARIDATDNDLPAEMFSPEEQASAPAEKAPIAEPVQKMDDLTGDQIKEKVRSYDDKGVTRAQVKDFSLKVSGKKEPKEITKSEWASIFTQLDSAFASGGKQALQELVKG